MNKRKLGSEKELKAKNELINNEYKILEVNYYTKFGEIDIIAKDGNYLVFVEVKYRSGCISGFPEEAVNYTKIRKISKAASYYIYKNKLSLDMPYRFDVVAIEKDNVRIIKNAFDFIG